MTSFWLLHALGIHTEHRIHAGFYVHKEFTKNTEIDASKTLIYIYIYIITNKFFRKILESQGFMIVMHLIVLIIP